MILGYTTFAQLGQAISPALGGKLHGVPAPPAIAVVGVPVVQLAARDRGKGKVARGQVAALLQRVEDVPAGLRKAVRGKVVPLAVNGEEEG
jgi:uncharacterized protein YwbE